MRPLAQRSSRGTPLWRLFLRPGWISLSSVVVLFAILCFWVFAPWQLGKHTRTEKHNTSVEKALSAPPVPLTDFLRSPFSRSSEWRSVTVEGNYDYSHQVLLRDRHVYGVAQGPQVLVPFLLSDGTKILVNRGFIDQGDTVPPPAPQDRVTINGKIRLAEITPQRREPRQLPSHFWEVPAIDPLVITDCISVPSQRESLLSPLYLQLDSAQSGSLGVLEEPSLDSGPYLSYGLQWLAFGTIAVVALFYFAYSEVRSRRGVVHATTVAGESFPSSPSPPSGRAERKRQLRAELAGHVSTTIPPAPDSYLADRYGR